jgi:hypothetical protein
VTTQGLTTVVAEYDELVLTGSAPGAESFAARYPQHPTLLGRLRQLEQLRGELGRLLAPPAPSETPPSIPGLEILRPLASGGMGVVYAARQERPRRLCAVKVVARDLLGGERRFEREADLAGRLSHPGIATVFSYGTVDGRPYLVTELVHGFSLRALLQVADLLDPSDPSEWVFAALRRLADGAGTAREAPARGAPVEAALSLGHEIALALAHAHERGVVHRDVKPSNVMVTLEGHAKLVDFGIAVPIEGADARLTVAGAFVGSLAYAAPEQLRGEPEAEGPWTDTYALGATLFEVLTSRPPFGDATFAERLAAADRPPPASPREVNRAVPVALDRVIMRALAPRPRDRYPDGHAMAMALADAASPRVFSLGGAPRRLAAVARSRRAWVAMAVTLLVAAWSSERLGRRDAELELAAARVGAVRSALEWAATRAHAELVACVELRPVPYETPRVEARATVDGGRVTALELLPGTRLLTRGARDCVTGVLRELPLPPLGGPPVTLDLSLALELPEASTARE